MQKWSKIYCSYALNKVFDQTGTEISSFQGLFAIEFSALFNFHVSDEFGIKKEYETSFDIIAARCMCTRS